VKLIFACFVLLLTPSLWAVRENKKIQHPDSAKGLIRIEKDGAYIYETKPLETKASSHIRFGMMPRLDLSSEYYDQSGQLQKLSFAEMYSDSHLPFFMFDYEWQPFRSAPQLGLQLGGGLFFVQGHGRLISTNQESEEQFMFFGLPLTAGGVYRFQFSPRPWMAPYVTAGGMAFTLAEKRDDKNTPKFFVAPGIYGGGGLMFNVASLDKEMAYNLNSEYGIGQIWVTLDFRFIKTFSESLDIGTGLFSGGLSMDF